LLADALKYLLGQDNRDITEILLFSGDRETG